MNLQINKIAHLLGHNAPIYALSPFFEQETFLSGGSDGYLASWDLNQLPNGRLEMRVEGCIFCVDFLPERGWAVVGTMQGGIYWLDLHKKCLIKQKLAHEKGVFWLKFIKNQLFSCGADGCLSIWDLDTQKPLETLHISSHTLRNFAYVEDKNQLFVAASGGNIHTIDLDNFSLKNTIVQAHNNSIFGIFYDQTRQQIWTGGRDAYLKGWDINFNPQPSAPTNNHSDINCFFSAAAHLFSINAVALNPNRNFIATGSRDKTLRIWNPETQELIKSVDFTKNAGHLRSINNLLWINDTHLVSASDDKSLIVWEIKS